MDNKTPDILIAAAEAVTAAAMHARENLPSLAHVNFAAVDAEVARLIRANIAKRDAELAKRNA